MRKLLLLPLILLFSGCSTIEGWFGSPNSAPYIQAAVDIAVATAESKGISAAQINSIAKQALAADTGTTATLAAIATLVDQQIAKLKLPAGDQAAANILMAALEAVITAKIGTSKTVAAAEAATALVLNDVIAAS
jgi:hypothetical protein